MPAAARIYAADGSATGWCRQHRCPRPWSRGPFFKVFGLSQAVQRVSRTPVTTRAFRPGHG